MSRWLRAWKYLPQEVHDDLDRPDMFEAVTMVWVSESKTFYDYLIICLAGTN